MPTITIVNDTQVPLHISLRHISPIHFVNNVAPGSPAVFKNVGRVWFTIEARIARGGSDNNEYNLVETFAAPVGVSLCVLSLGAGAVWVAGAATAAGGVGAAITSISARIGATAASQAPTARRLYKYARQGQHIVQIGQVLGIGGGALLGKKAAEAQQQQHGPPLTQAERKQQEQGGKSWFKWDENARVKEAKKVLKGLLEGSVVSSAGWYMKKERLLRIKGGPRATEMEGLLVIETDTLQPFEVVSDESVEEDGKAAFGDGTGEGALATWWSSLSHRRKGKSKEGKEEISDSQTSFAGLEQEKNAAKSGEEGTSYQRYQKEVYDRLNESSQWLYSRIRRGPADPAPREEPEEEGEELIVEKDNTAIKRAQSPAPPPDDDPSQPPTLDIILGEMGFDAKQIQEAKSVVGDFPASRDQEEIRSRKVEEAMAYLLKEEAASNVNEKGSVTSTDTLAATSDVTPSSTPAMEKPPPQVVRAEAVTTPHWTTRAKQAAESSGAIKILNLGGSHLIDKGESWLQRSDHSKKT